MLMTQCCFNVDIWLKRKVENLLIFRQPLPLVRFQNMEWFHKNKMYTFTLTPFLPLKAYVLYGCSHREVNSKNFKKIIHFPILKAYTQRNTTCNFLSYRCDYFFKCGIFQCYFTWPCTDICLKGTIYKNDMAQFVFLVYMDQMWRVEKNVIWKNISYFVWRFLQCKLNKN